MPFEKLIVMGNKGFLGSNLENYLRKTINNIEIIGLGRKDIDLTSKRESYALCDHFDKKTAVILISGVKRNEGDSLELFNQNVSMVSNFCEALEKTPIAHLVYISSTAVYGEDIDYPCITELTPVHPTSFYGMSKYISERILWKSLKTASRNLLVLRPPTIYGPGDLADAYGPVKFLNAVMDKKPITLWGDGKELREFIYIEDMIEILSMLTFSKASGILNITSGKSYSFLQIIDTIKQSGFNQVPISSMKRTKNKVNHVFDNSKLLRTLGFYEFTSLKKGLSGLILNRG